MPPRSVLRNKPLLLLTASALAKTTRARLEPGPDHPITIALTERNVVVRVGDQGVASYYTLTTPDGGLENVIWTYEEPYEAVGEIAGHVAF